MASIGTRYSGKFSRPSFLPTNKPNPNFLPNPLFSIYNAPRKTPQLNVSASIPSSNHSISPHPKQVPADSASKGDDFLGKIDSWMQDSVSDIVKNLKQAPLLVQIYSESRENGTIKIQTEKAMSENWPTVMEKWRSGASKSPDGLIFVEELEQENEENQEGVTRAWGIVVQGKGVECGPACYLLKTNRVCSALGLGFCTHFCLMRVNNFRDSAFQQFKDSWLLQ